MENSAKSFTSFVILQSCLESFVMSVIYDIL